jgi:hypothetical protein
MRLYPSVIAGALLLLAAFRDAGASLAWSPYVAATIAGIGVVAAERFVPYRSQWQPRSADLLDDALFLTLVQLLLPLALTWTVAWLAQSWIAEHSARLALWPNEWPILAQLAAKIAVGDFLRYWLHRAAYVDAAWHFRRAPCAETLRRTCSGSIRLRKRSSSSAIRCRSCSWASAPKCSPITSPFTP